VKTIYIKQVALITILAQIGCFVPATYALIPIRDKILTRLGSNDDIEHNMSTFSIEMKEAAYILDNCTKRSLVLIDELGRGSSNVDGEIATITIHYFVL
jgi:DNA mismatch repair ATPase MutS